MKKSMICRILPFLAAVLVFTSIPVYGAPSGEAASSAQGSYTLFAIKNQGMTVRSDELDASSVIILEGDGKGNMTMDTDSIAISVWEPSGKTAVMQDGNPADSVITITLEDGSVADAAVRSGVLELDTSGTGQMFLLYSREGADISGYSPMTMEEARNQIQNQKAKDPFPVPESGTRLYALWKRMDPEAGIHMSYSRYLPSMYLTNDYEVHGKGGKYYCKDTSGYSGRSSSKFTYAGDGMVYALKPESMTAVPVTEIYLESVKNRTIMMDHLYQTIYKKLRDGTSTEGVREINGAVYITETYPATEYEPESVFCFADDGTLVYYIEGAPVFESASQIGESHYKIHSIDSRVDESLLTLSGYQITQ